MGRKNVVPGFAMIEDGDMSENITSSIVNVLNMDKASIHLEWDGTAVDGEISIEVNNGENHPWYELDLNTVIALDTDSGDHQIIFNELPFTQMRLNYERTAGTGALNAFITAKMVGG